MLRDNRIFGEGPCYPFCSFGALLTQVVSSSGQMLETGATEVTDLPEGLGDDLGIGYMGACQAQQGA